MCVFPSDDAEELSEGACERERERGREGEGIWKYNRFQIVTRELIGETTRVTDRSQFSMESARS